MATERRDGFWHECQWEREPPWEWGDSGLSWEQADLRMQTTEADVIHDATIAAMVRRATVASDPARHPAARGPASARPHLRHARDPIARKLETRFD